MSDEKYDWNWALTENCIVPFLELRTKNSLIGYLPAPIKNKIREYTLFAAHECLKRESTGKIPLEWSILCNMRSAVKYHYSPRWTAPVFYFRNRFSTLFQGRVGLDIGAKVGSIEGVLKRGLYESLLRNVFLIESLTPHFKHYSNLGSHMRAIDLNAPDPIYKEIELGDARCLFFASNSFDFITIPMLLGHGNPCSTYLEIALCLCELKRVLHPGGFIYIADAGFQPSVGFAAQCLDFELYISKGSTDGLPIGVLLRKRNGKTQFAGFDIIFNSSEIFHVTFNAVGDETVYNCNLLFDKENILIVGD